MEERPAAGPAGQSGEGTMGSGRSLQIPTAASESQGFRWWLWRLPAYGLVTAGVSTSGGRRGQCWADLPSSRTVPCIPAQVSAGMREG
jgi:hypothetical protein